MGGVGLGCGGGPGDGDGGNGLGSGVVGPCWGFSLTVGRLLSTINLHYIRLTSLIDRPRAFEGAFEICRLKTLCPRLECFSAHLRRLAIGHSRWTAGVVCGEFQPANPHSVRLLFSESADTVREAVGCSNRSHKSMYELRHLITCPLSLDRLWRPARRILSQYIPRNLRHDPLPVCAISPQSSPGATPSNISDFAMARKPRRVQKPSSSTISNARSAPAPV